MPDAIERALQSALDSGSSHLGQIAIRASGHGYFLTHRDDVERSDLRVLESVEEALHLARFDDSGKYRPLKTAPNLAHGWKLQIATREDLCHALSQFYPGRLAAFAAWKRGQLAVTPLRETLERQSGMYRVAARISDDQINETVGDFCRSDGGCLRTILWKRDVAGMSPSTKLPAEKFDPSHDQTGRAEMTIPLLCQEACNLLVSACRKAVKGE